MKKEKSLNFLCSKFFMVVFIALGMTLFSSTTAIAQASPLSDEITFMTEQRDGFAPGTAKYDLAQNAIDYLVLLDAGIIANPHYLSDLEDQSGQDPFKAAPLRRAHKTVLANYNAAQLASFANYVAENNSGAISDPAGAQKRQWILDANAY